MNIVKSNFSIIEIPKYIELLNKIERIAKVCYKSEDNITNDTAIPFIRSAIKRGHESIIEHGSITVLFYVDRGVTHEAVRHRLASPTQESTRYCCYSKEKFNNQITVISPKEHFKNIQSFVLWESCMSFCETTYNSLINLGESPQIARGVLPTSLKSELFITANIREWRTILKLRAAGPAHPQMREVMEPLLKTLKMELPVFFEDILA